MAECSKRTVHLLVALSLLICLVANATEAERSNADRVRVKRQFFGFPMNPFDWFHGGGYRMHYGFRPFFGQRPFGVRRFWRRRFNRIGFGWW
ncbi:unnamed protein product [Litomosoides sigmodontis]|uniref:Uncharacterized protein n=1 Tax=Litomosoides sigmodontis TaxID=42156 RepID=A0A3P6TUV1_LITSI|nr:unnamed protein product [Litomosoides sigmodontis]